MKFPPFNKTPVQYVQESLSLALNADKEIILRWCAEEVSEHDLSVSDIEGKIEAILDSALKNAEDRLYETFRENNCEELNEHIDGIINTLRNKSVIRYLKEEYSEAIGDAFASNKTPYTEVLATEFSEYVDALDDSEVKEALLKIKKMLPQAIIQFKAGLAASR